MSCGCCVSVSVRECTYTGFLITNYSSKFVVQQRKHEKRLSVDVSLCVCVCETHLCLTDSQPFVINLFEVGLCFLFFHLFLVLLSRQLEYWHVSALVPSIHPPLMQVSSQQAKQDIRRSSPYTFQFLQRDPKTPLNRDEMQQVHDSTCACLENLQNEASRRKHNIPEPSQPARFHTKRPVEVSVHICNSTTSFMLKRDPSNPDRERTTLPDFRDPVFN